MASANCFQSLPLLNHATSSVTAIEAIRFICVGMLSQITDAIIDTNKNPRQNIAEPKGMVCSFIFSFSLI